jgi:hypothetical protein
VRCRLIKPVSYKDLLPLEKEGSDSQVELRSSKSNTGAEESSAQALKLMELTCWILKLLWFISPSMALFEVERPSLYPVTVPQLYIGSASVSLDHKFVSPRV